MFYNLCYIFMIFFVASVVGYFAEIIACSIVEKKLVFNRGFMIGPYIPIYGVGTVLCVLTLSKYKNDLAVVFCMSAIFSTVLEYLSSYVMQKIFWVRWWDYSDRRFNIEGRVCLLNSFIFGIAGIAVILILYPFVKGLVIMIPNLVLEILAIVFYVLFTADFIFTTTTLFNIRDKLKKMNTKDITKLAHEEVMKELGKEVKKHNFSMNRILQAFPDNEKVNRKEYKELKDLVFKYRMKKKNKDK